MTTIAIMQPTYLPWLGYFNLIASVDHFVLFDDVQFCRRSWHHRNKILVDGNEKWLSVPTKGPSRQLIKDVVVDDSRNWRGEHLAAIQKAYYPLGQADGHGEAVFWVVASILNRIGSKNLSFINHCLINAFLKEMGIYTPISCSSAIPRGIEDHGKLTRIVEICRWFGADTLLNAAGSKEMIDANCGLAQHGINVFYQEHSPAWPHLSCVHTMAHEGFKRTADIIRNRALQGI